jgi:hypothetical protein
VKDLFQKTKLPLQRGSFEAMLTKAIKMKKTFSFLVLALVMQSQISLANDNECNKEYGLDVAYCSQAFDKADLTAKQRASYHKACVANAQASKSVCETGTNPCLEGCSATHASAVATCEQTHDISVCNFDEACILAKQTLLAACIGTATDALNTCNLGCGI